jgi:hypothetical protein
MAPGFTFLVPTIGTEPGSDTSQAADPEQSIASVHEVDMIVPNDADTSVGEPGSGLLHGTGLAAPTSCNPIPTHSCVARCDSEPCEQPKQDGDTVSPYLVSPQPNTVHVLAAATSPSRNEFALTKALADAQGHTRRNGYHGLHTRKAGFDQLGRISERCNSVPQTPWTEDLDEFVLPPS